MAGHLYEHFWHSIIGLRFNKTRNHSQIQQLMHKINQRTLPGTICLFMMLCFGELQAQDGDIALKRLSKISILNPGFEMQVPKGEKWLTAINLGVGYHGSYPELSRFNPNGLQVLISPFLDVQQRFYYNRARLARKGKNIRHNSGSFIMARTLIRSGQFYSNFTRTSDFDLAFGIGYGFQKSKGRMNFAFSVAPFLYTDLEGNWGFFPIIPEVSLGINLKKGD